MALPPSNGKTVLITGINGYIASVLGSLVLSKGYALRGTSRKRTSTESLLAGPYAQYKDRVEIFEVPDMTTDGAFDEAAKGVHGVFHTASPINFSLDTFEETVIPAIKGSEVLLQSALKAGPQLEAVVITSSVVAIIDPQPPKPDHAWTEESFASFALNQAEKDRSEGTKTPGNILYSASKTAADRRVWEFRKEHKPSFSISSVNPSVVIGPPVTVPSSGEGLNETLRPLFKILSGSKAGFPAAIGSGSFVDVRDVATIHLWALENPSKSDGERYIAGAGYGPPQAAADVLAAKYKGTKIGETLLRGAPGEGYIGFDKEKEVVTKVQYLPGKPQVSGKKAEREVGLKYITFQNSVSDFADVLERLL